jgi:hypothetical protein
MIVLCCRIIIVCPKEGMISIIQSVTAVKWSVCRCHSTVESLHHFIYISCLPMKMSWISTWRWSSPFLLSQNCRRVLNKVLPWKCPSVRLYWGWTKGTNRGNPLWDKFHLWGLGAKLRMALRFLWQIAQTLKNDAKHSNFKLQIPIYNFPKTCPT